MVDPETSKPIPEFVAAIELIAGGRPTFQEPSGAGAGVHAMFRGSFPDRSSPRYIQLRNEPIADAYDDPPVLELFQGKRVNVFTGKKVAGTPDEYAPVDEEGLRRVLRAGSVVSKPDGPRSNSA